MNVRSDQPISRSTMDTRSFSREEVDAWQLPLFQRPLRINDKVREVAALILKQGGIVPGVITLGYVEADPSTYYLVDGQHRVEAYKQTELPQCTVDVRMIVAKSIAELSEEFVELNSRLVVMKPDDILRGLESRIPALTAIRDRCPFVAYDNVRRGTATALVSMSATLRIWSGGKYEKPVGNSAGKSVAELAESLTSDEVDRICRFLNVAYAAWGREPENYRLWGALNLTLSAWLYIRIVLDRAQVSRTKRWVVADDDLFCKCLMSLSADKPYCDWLIGRNMSERDRSPAMTRIKSIFAKRIEIETGSKAALPQPSWLSKQYR